MDKAGDQSEPSSLEGLFEREETGGDGKIDLSVAFFKSAPMEKRNIK